MPVQPGGVEELMPYDKGLIPDHMCPCKGCEERQPVTGCHDRCPKYQAWKADHEKRNAARRAALAVDVLSDSSKREIWRKSRYGKQKKKRIRIV